MSLNPTTMQKARAAAGVEKTMAGQPANTRQDRTELAALARADRDARSASALKAAGHRLRND